jgi:hypothetical protein
MKLSGFFIFLFLILAPAGAQQRKIYLAPDDHTDYMWSADEEGYRNAFLETLDYYIKLNDSTANDPYPYQSKWNCDGSYRVYEYQKNRSQEQFTRLIDQIRDGRITVPLNTLPEVLGIAPLELTLRDMYYAGAMIMAKEQSDGRHYADSICRLDWIAMNHYASISDGRKGMIISNRDAFLMKTGNSTIKWLDPGTPQIRVLAGGQIDAPGLGIVSQDFDSYFENFFALKPDLNGYNPANGMRFSLEHQNPLIAGRIKGNSLYKDPSYSLFEVNNPDVLVWALKPAEEGIDNGIIMRVWNMNGRDETFTITSPSGISRCFLTSHIETDISEIKPESGVLNLKIGHNQLQTCRIFIK